MKVEEAPAEYFALINPETDSRQWKTMGDIAEVVGGGTPRTSDASNFENGDIPWLTPADLSGYTEKYVSHGARFITRKGLESSSARLLPAGSVLFTSRAPIGYVAIARNPIATNQGFKSFVLKEGILPEYVYWWLKGAKHIAEGLASGTTFLELSGANAKKLPIPLVPLDQQKRIVAEIEKQFSRLDEAVANLKRVKANLKRYKAAVLKAAVEGRLVETEAERARREGRSYETGAQLLQRILETRRSQWQGKGKYKEPAAPDTTDLPELPEGWVWASVEQIANLVTDGDHNPPKRTPTGVPHLTAKHIREWRVDPTDCTFISKDDAVRVFKRYHPKAGDLIVTCVGTVGRTAIVPNSFEFSPDRNLAAIRFFSGTLDVKFLQIVLESSDYQKLLRGASGSTAQPHLYLSDLRSLLIPLVATREQQRIVTEVDRLLSLITDVDAKAEANLKRAELLLKSTLSKAFRGQLMSEGAITVKVPEEYAVNGRAAAEKLTGARHEY